MKVGRQFQANIKIGFCFVFSIIKVLTYEQTFVLSIDSFVILKPGTQ